MRSTFFALPLWVLASALLGGTAMAQSGTGMPWKWRDAQGHITVSDRPPPRDVADKDILQRPSANARQARAAAEAASAAASGAEAGGAAASGAARPVDRELEARKRAADAERAAKARAEQEKLAAQHAENCKRSREQIATLESGQRIARINAKGEREFLDDAARASELRVARDVAASECR